MSKETINPNQEKVKQKKSKKKYGCLKGVLIFILVLLLLGGAVYGAAHMMLSRINREELEDLKTVIAYEERKKNKTFEPIDFDDFLEEREKKYGVKF